MKLPRPELSARPEAACDPKGLCDEVLQKGLAENMPESLE